MTDNTTELTWNDKNSLRSNLRGMIVREVKSLYFSRYVPEERSGREEYEDCTKEDLLDMWLNELADLIDNHREAFRHECIERLGPKE
jgi:hypothetical protein